MREATAGKVAAIVVGAGSGQRLGGIEKAFMPLAGHPLIAHSVGLLERMPEIDEICLVVADFGLSKARVLVDRYAWRKVTAIVPGGATRQDSVLAGLHACSTSEWVMIHDAARPLLTKDIVRRGLQTVTLSGAALAAIPVRDTIKQALPGSDSSSAPLVKETVDRSTLWLAQTPQVFRTSLLRAAFAHLGGEAGKMTDDAAVAQAAGHQVHVFNGDARNLKVTLPEDVTIAEALLAHSSPLLEGEGTGAQKAEIHPPHLERAFRPGIGYDIHRLVPDRPFILGGVHIPFELGLHGHSDADVVTHAVIDALFGACGLPDIGRHFPPSDPAYRNADSLDLLRQAVARCRDVGWHPSSLDSTVVCERPKLAPHIDEMRTKLAAALGLVAECVNVKAKTNEGLDAVGRGEAVAAHAIILVERIRKD